MTKVDESARWKKIPSFDRLEPLKKWVNRGVFVHFGSVNKLGINPQFSYTQPMGIYGYELTGDVLEKILSGGDTFAGKREFIHVFRPRHPSMIVYSSDITADEVKVYADELVGMNLLDAATVDSTKNLPPYDRLYRLTKVASGGDPKKWGILFRKLAVDGIVDQKRNIAAFFGGDTVVQLDTVTNPNWDTSENV